MKCRASRALLEGYRGQPPGDTAALEDVLLRVSRMVGDLPEIHEVDLNPLKVLAPELSRDAGFRERFRLESRLAASIDHPNVIPIFDVGMWGDQVFLAMELADGGTLSGWLEEEHSWREVLERFLAAGRGLVAAHEAGLVHRDFKPANVLVTRAGRVYVTDFGLALQVGASQRDDDLSDEARELMPPERRLLEVGHAFEQLTRVGERRPALGQEPSS